MSHFCSASQQVLTFIANISLYKTHFIAKYFTVCKSFHWLLSVLSFLDIDQLISVSGMVIRNSNLIPEMRIAFFCCYVCNSDETVEIDRGRITEPTLCQKCNTNHSFTLVHNRSVFSDKQLIKLQESPGNLKRFISAKVSTKNNSVGAL